MTDQADATDAPGGTAGPDLATAWRGLVAAALLGTDRSGGQPVVLPAPAATTAGAAGLRLDDGGPASLLAGAALLDVARSAGRRPAAGDAEPVPPARPDTAPVARTSPATVVRLLAGPAEQLEEWLELVRDRGLLVPHDALPGLLRVAAARPGLRHLVRQVVGERGVWLVGFDPQLASLATAWRTRGTPPESDAAGDGEGRAVPAPTVSAVPPGGNHAGGTPTGSTQAGADDVWRFGDHAARVAWLSAARRRDPAGSRELLAAELRSLPVDQRAALLGVLAAGLGDADEPLLERCLDDRAGPVRRAAALLLCRLPRSAHADRARARARAHVRLDAQPGQAVLVVELPEPPFDAAALRDGLVEPVAGRAAGARGDRAERLHQVVAAAPLDTWVPALAPSVEELLRLPVADDRAPLLHAGWAAATVREHDGAWATTLLRAAPGLASRLVPQLPPTLRARAAVVLLRGSVPERDAALAVLRDWPRPWPADLVDAVVGAVRRTPADAGWVERTRAGQLAALLGSRADPLTTALDPGDDRALQHAAATLADRRQTFEETHA
ncbi:DUF5691 domain-containing protein [Aquipuribacter hungaricus]|uniref:DUF5691 domain-containing protein n=1 Tax=Aquipuribacter hungaricus TaxID=545624 RepID=A0ABV7WJ78_9MICO